MQVRYPHNKGLDKKSLIAYLTEYGERTDTEKQVGFCPIACQLLVLILPLPKPSLVHGLLGSVLLSHWRPSVFMPGRIFGLK